MDVTLSDESSYVIFRTVKEITSLNVSPRPARARVCLVRLCKIFSLLCKQLCRLELQKIVYTEIHDQCIIHAAPVAKSWGGRMILAIYV